MGIEELDRKITNFLIQFSEMLSSILKCWSLFFLDFCIVFVWVREAVDWPTINIHEMGFIDFGENILF